MKFIDEINIKNKTVILRSDFNVPIKNNKIEDDFRIVKELKTINYLLQNNCKIIILSHLGKVKTKEDIEKNSLKIVYEKLKELINTNIYFSKELTGENLKAKVNQLQEKEILLLENTRFLDLDNKKESNCDEELSKYWASLGDIFVMDAFGTAHRKHASTYGISRFLNTCYGFLIKEEVNVLNEALHNNDKILILGGAKIEDKLKLIKNLVRTSKKIIVGGKMSATFLEAKGDKIDKSQVDYNSLNEIKKIYQENVNKFILPIDIITPEEEIIEVNNLNFDNNADLGPKTIELIKQNIQENDMVVWNGPIGNTDISAFEKGTMEILNYLQENKVKTIIAGGDTANIAHKNNFDFYHISTGGGATLNYLEGEKLEALGGTYEENNI